MATREAAPKSKSSNRPARRTSDASRGGSKSQGELQVNIRVAQETSDWLVRHAGGRRAVPAYVRELIERERAAERERELLEMFNRAAEDLTDEDREERRLFMQAHPSNRE